MIIKKETVAEVVEEASKKMADPNYSAVLVGGFVQEQPNCAQYISASARELGGAEGVAHACFHAAVLGICFQRGYGRSVRQISFEELDHAAVGERKVEMKVKQPHVLDYIEQNIELSEMQSVLMLLALAMEWVS